MALQNRSMFYRLTDAMEKSGDIALAYAFHRDQMRRDFLQGQERERLIEEVTDRVLSRLSMTIDITALRNASKEIDDFFKKYE